MLVQQETVGYSEDSLFFTWEAFYIF